MSRSAVSRTDLLWALQLSADCQALVLPEVEQLALAFQRRQRQAEPEGKGGLDGGRLLERAQTSHRLPLRMPTGWHGDMVLHHDEGPVDDEGFELPSSPVPKLQRPSREAAQALQRRVDAPESAHLARARFRASICQVLPWQSSVDWPRMVRQLAQGEWLAQLPRRRSPRWPAQLHVLVDSESPSVASFRHDIEAMLASLKRAMGGTGLVVHRVGPGLTELQGPRSLGWASTGQKWLVLGDGRVDEMYWPPVSTGPADVFAAWVKRMRRAQNQVLLIGPLFAHALPALPDGVSGRSWSCSRAVVGRGQRGAWFETVPAEAATVSDLVLMLGQVSGLLLRALCQRVAVRGRASGVEWAVWNNPFMARCGSYLTPAHGPMSEGLARQRLEQLPLSLLQDARRLQQHYQHALPDADLHLTTLRIAEMAPQMAECLAAEVQAAKLFLHQVATQTDSTGLGAARLLEAAKAARMVNKASPSLRAAHRGLFRQVASWAYRDNLERGEDIPQWEELGTLLPAHVQDVDEAAADRQMWSLQIKARGVCLKNDAQQTPHFAQVVAGPIGPLSPSRGVSLHEKGSSRWLRPLQSGMVCHELSTATQAFELDFGEQSIQVQRVPRPHWAASFAQTSAGLRALIHLPNGDGLWLDPLRQPAAEGLQNRMPGFRLIFDAYGPRLYRDWPFANWGGLTGLVESDWAFRYLPPSTFLMGSPDGVGEDDEHPQHPVTISQGLWMAESPCTQALWQAVMGSNPSHFNKGPEAPQRPVESVSWNDVQQFLARLNKLLPKGCEAVLPTEAQWEYACRAGTQTAYSWGDEPDDSRANFNNRGDKGWGFEEGTTPVDRYPPNPWGLRDLHGNVWEWCADDQRSYKQGMAFDPMGDIRGEDRVVRGGSWIVLPSRVRAAYRDGRRRDGSAHAQGFRIALRSSSLQGAEPHRGGLKAQGVSTKGRAAGGREAGAGASGKATRAAKKVIKSKQGPA